MDLHDKWISGSESVTNMALRRVHRAGLILSCCSDSDGDQGSSVLGHESGRREDGGQDTRRKPVGLFGRGLTPQPHCYLTPIPSLPSLTQPPDLATAHVGPAAVLTASDPCRSSSSVTACLTIPTSSFPSQPLLVILSLHCKSLGLVLLTRTV